MNPEPEPEIEAALRSLAPTRPPIDRDRVFYEAGRASTHRPSRTPWPAIAAGLALIATVEGGFLAAGPRIAERVVVVREPAPLRSPEPPVIVQIPPPPRPVEPEFGRTKHDRLAAQLIRYGLDGLPESPPSGRGDPSPETPWRASTRRGFDDAGFPTLTRPGDAS